MFEPLGQGQVVLISYNARLMDNGAGCQWFSAAVQRQSTVTLPITDVIRIVYLTSWPDITYRTAITSQAALTRCRRNDSQ